MLPALAAVALVATLAAVGRQSSVAHQEGGVYAVYLADRRASAKVHAFTEFLARKFGSPPYWDRDKIRSALSDRNGTLTAETMLTSFVLAFGEGPCARRRQDDDRAPRSAHPPLRHRRDRQRQLALQVPRLIPPPPRIRSAASLGTTAPRRRFECRGRPGSPLSRTGRGLRAGRRVGCRAGSRK